MNSPQLKKLLEEQKPPFYVFDAGELRRRIQTLRRALPGHIRICYAVKANTFILKEMRALGIALRSARPASFASAGSWSSLRRNS